MAGHDHGHELHAGEHQWPGDPRERAELYLRAPGGEDGPPVDDGVQVEIVVTLHGVPDRSDPDGGPVRFGAGVAAPTSDYQTAVEQVEGLAVGALATLLDLMPLSAERYGLEPGDAEPLGWARSELTRVGADPHRASVALTAVAAVAALSRSVGVEDALDMVASLVRQEVLP